jgi:hypothetical protein
LVACLGGAIWGGCVMIKLLVKGSAKEPYQVTAEGRGGTFRMFCSCPAGRKGGKFCKHAAAILMGDVTNLVSPAGDVEAVKAMAEGSPLLGAALNHVPAKPKSAHAYGYAGLADLFMDIEKDLEERGWIPKLVEPDLDGDEALELYELIKSGKRPYKWPSVVLYRENFEYDYIAQEDGSTLAVKGHPRSRPWGLRTKDKTNTWGSLDRALPAFFEVARMSAYSGRNE